MSGSLKQTLVELVKFNLVGGFNTALTYGFYASLVYLGVDYTYALASEYILGTLVGFWRFTFGHHEKTTSTLFGKMVITVLITFGINLAVLWVLVEHFGLDQYLSQFLALCLVVISQFVGQKFFVFKKH